MRDYHIKIIAIKSQSNIMTEIPPPQGAQGGRHARRPRPQRRPRPGGSRPRAVFNLDGITAVAPPEAQIQIQIQTQAAAAAAAQIQAAASQASPSETQIKILVQAAAAAAAASSAKTPDNDKNTTNLITLPKPTKLEPTMTREKNNNPDRDNSSSNDKDKEIKQQQQSPSSACDDGDDYFLDSSDDEFNNTTLRRRPRPRNPDDVVVHAKKKEKKKEEPWWMNDEAPHLVEDWVMNRLDELVTFAEEKDEEQYIMDLFDKKIFISEENDIMQSLLENITAAEDIDFVKSYPIRRMTGNINENETTDNKTSNNLGWKNIRKRKNHPTIQEKTTMKTSSSSKSCVNNDGGAVNFSNSTDTGGATISSSCPDGDDSPMAHFTRALHGGSSTNGVMVSSSKVSGTVDEIKFRSIRQALPKYIPTNSGSYHDNELLFTRDDFCYNVIEPLSNKIPTNIRNNSSIWMVNISDHHPNDPHGGSYLLEARSASCIVIDDNNQEKEKYLDMLKDHTEAYVRKRIAFVNLKRILDDDYSLELDVALEIHKDVIGIKFSQFSIVGGEQQQQQQQQQQLQSTGGLWMKGVIPDKGLAQALGGHEACENGCAILSIDGLKISDALELKRVLIEAKKDKTKELVIMTICLSRYANLERVPNRLMQNIRRRDGKPYDPIFYQTLNAPPPPHPPLLPSELLTNQSDDSKEHRGEDKKGKSAATVNVKKRRWDVQAESSVDDLHDDESHTVTPTSNDADFPTADADADNIDDEQQESGSSHNGTTVKNPFQRFGEFEKKFRPLVHLEYKDTKIHEKSILSSMWVQHKLLFGETCGGNCNCISQLPELIANVVKDHISKQEIKGKKNFETEQELEERICGIFLYFVPRFVPLLKKEYPTGTHAELINRLIYMWSLHQKHRMYNGMFGVQCSEDCGCEGEWDDIFGRGAKERDRSVQASSSKRPPYKASSKGSQSSLLERNTSHGSIDVMKNVDLGQVIFPHSVGNNDIRRPSFINPTARPSFINPTVNSAFEIAFDATRPLGGYFRTENGQNFRSKCVLFSKYANGQLSMDVRIKVGTQVMAVMVAERRRTVSSHTDLQSFYILASKKRQKLRIILENHHPSSSKTEFKSVPDGNWNSRGSWIGNNYHGWAGGANCIGVDRRMDQNRSGPNRSISNSNTNRSSHDNGKKSESRQSWGPSSRGWQHSTQQHPTTQTENQVQMPSITHHAVPIKDTLLDAVKNKSCRDLIYVLENGPALNKASFDSVLREQYNYVGREIEKIKLSTQFSAIHRENDLEAKKKVLKLYINSTHLIEKALSLRYWTVISFELKHLELEIESSVVSGRSNVISGSVRTQFPVSELGNLPVRKFSHYISYSDKIDDDEELFHRRVNNNYNVTLDNRRLVIDIAEGSLHDSFPPNKLGSFVFTLNEIEQKCPKDGSWSVDITSRVESVGVICIVAKHRSAERDYITIKKKEIIDSLKTQIENIERFNQEQSSSLKLTSNVRGLNGTPLLYAAIELMAPTSLLHRILRLGADPKRSERGSKDVVGTPIDLARKRYDRCRTKESDLRNKYGTPPAMIEAQSQLCAEAKSLLDMLLLVR
jgi:hypothetical protein